MGVTITTVALGDTMSATIQRTNMTTIRNWLNGGIVQADIAKNTLKSRHFRRMDHFGGMNERSIGITGSQWHQAIPASNIRRTYAIVDAQGVALWEDVPDIAIRGYAPSAGWIEVVTRVWVWPIRADSATAEVPPENTDALDVRLAVGATGVGYTERRAWDSGHNTDTATGDPGQYVYGARNLHVMALAQVSAGPFDVSFQVKVLSQASRGLYGLSIIGSANHHIEYYAK